jgi:hypothetical protein
VQIQTRFTCFLGKTRGPSKTHVVPGTLARIEFLPASTLVVQSFVLTSCASPSKRLLWQILQRSNGRVVVNVDIIPLRDFGA